MCVAYGDAVDLMIVYLNASDKQFSLEVQYIKPLCLLRLIKRQTKVIRSDRLTERGWKGRTL